MPTLILIANRLKWRPGSQEATLLDVVDGSIGAPAQRQIWRRQPYRQALAIPIRNQIQGGITAVCAKVGIWMNPG
jgi:hypothetical protein